MVHRDNLTEIAGCACPDAVTMVSDTGHVLYYWATCTATCHHQLYFQFNDRFFGEAGLANSPSDFFLRSFSKTTFGISGTDSYSSDAVPVTRPMLSKPGQKIAVCEIMKFDAVKMLLLVLKYYMLYCECRCILLLKCFRLKTSLSPAVAYASVYGI